MSRLDVRKLPGVLVPVLKGVLCYARKLMADDAALNARILEKGLRSPGDVWQGPSGRWFTMRVNADGRKVVHPIRDPNPKTVGHAEDVIRAARKDGVITPERVRELAKALLALQRDELLVLKKKLGFKASGLKADLAEKIAKQALGAVRQENLKNLPNQGLPVSNESGKMPVDSQTPPTGGRPMKTIRQAKTAGGTLVTMESDHEGTTVSLAFQGQQLTGKLGAWVQQKGQWAAQTSIYLGGKPLLLSISRADYDAAKADVSAARQQRLDDIRSGDLPITATYQQGSPLSGYTVYDEMANSLLVGLGLAKAVEGWGYLLDPSVVSALGETFTYPQAEALVRPKLDAAAKKAQAKKEAFERRVAELAAEARRTGERQFLDSVVFADERPDEDSSMTQQVRFVYPDGSIKTEYNLMH